MGEQKKGEQNRVEGETGIKKGEEKGEEKKRAMERRGEERRGGERPPGRDAPDPRNSAFGARSGVLVDMSSGGICSSRILPGSFSQTSTQLLASMLLWGKGSPCFPPSFLPNPPRPQAVDNRGQGHLGLREANKLAAWGSSGSPVLKSLAILDACLGPGSPLCLRQGRLMTFLFFHMQTTSMGGWRWLYRYVPEAQPMRCQPVPLCPRQGAGRRRGVSHQNSSFPAGIAGSRCLSLSRSRSLC